MRACCILPYTRVFTLLKPVKMYHWDFKIWKCLILFHVFKYLGDYVGRIGTDVKICLWGNSCVLGEAGWVVVVQVVQREWFPGLLSICHTLQCPSCHLGAPKYIIVKLWTVRLSVGIQSFVDIEPSFLQGNLFTRKHSTLGKWDN